MKIVLPVRRPCCKVLTLIPPASKAALLGKNRFIRPEIPVRKLTELIQYFKASVCCKGGIVSVFL